MFKVWKRRLALFLLSGVIVTFVVFKVISPSEPTYQGQPLSYWLDETKAQPWARRNAARLAILRMGPETIPFLLKRLRYHKPWWKSKLEALSSKQKLIHLLPMDEGAYVEGGINGFWALQTNGVEALPVLTKMLNDPRDCDRAGRVLPYLDKTALPALTNAFSSPHLEIRAAAVRTVGVNQSYSSTMVPLILPLLKDSSSVVRGNAAQALGHFAIQPEIVIPALTNCLSDTNDYVLIGAILAIQHFRTNAVPAVPALLPFCQHSNVSVRDYARRAVQAIDPDAAAKAGIR